MATPALATTAVSFVDRIKSIVVATDAAITKYAAHIYSQAIVLETIATHDLSKWQSAIGVLATGSGVTLIKRLQTFIKTL